MPRNRGKRAREKREITTRELSQEERNALIDAVVEPPVAISHAIIGALAVEHELEISIKARLRRISPTEWENVLSDKEGPLGSLDRKIKFASYLGILDANDRANLDIIRNIRNKFAHTKRLISFAHPFIADELAKRIAPKGQKRRFARLSPFEPQWQYILLCMHCIRQMAHKRYGNKSAAYRAYLKRQQQRSKPVAGLAGFYASLVPTGASSIPELPISTLPHPKKKTGPDSSDPAPLGLLSGLLPLFEGDKENS